MTAHSARLLPRLLCLCLGLAACNEPPLERSRPLDQTGLAAGATGSSKPHPDTSHIASPDSFSSLDVARGDTVLTWAIPPVEDDRVRLELSVPTLVRFHTIADSVIRVVGIADGDGACPGAIEVAMRPAGGATTALDMGSTVRAWPQSDSISFARCRLVLDVYASAHRDSTLRATLHVVQKGADVTLVVDRGYDGEISLFQQFTLNRTGRFTVTSDVPLDVRDTVDFPVHPVAAKRRTPFAYRAVPAFAMLGARTLIRVETWNGSIALRRR